MLSFKMEQVKVQFCTIFIVQFQELISYFTSQFVMFYVLQLSQFMC